ncbi:MBL fold metallo-hydrolase [Streptomyces sp. H28]|uniref:MBL fold metallo-hydrolase n=1 Tax=Streptomyces sp. H28 TaxID=2775865 RepID=UPI00178123AF|nr:MBL fold metallo-hydrolase [Streptomyces sp. H28]MBD9732543.1 MBL fold metallo-hydrolase [Streptomyces sp. H28]
MRDNSLVRVADGVHLVHGSNTNWVVLSEGGSATLVDCGYPGDRALLLASLSALGHAPESVSAVLVTHAHNDHIGNAEYLSRTFGTPVHAHDEEIPHARREFLHQIGVGTVLRNIWRPGVAPWAVHSIRAGGLKDSRVAQPRPFPASSGPLDLPGRPVPLHTPGHTAGHCAYALPQAGIIISGDALVSGHPTTRARGPQLLPAMFDHDRERARASLDVLGAFEGDTLLPGHGPVHRGSVRKAAETARDRTPARFEPRR